MKRFAGIVAALFVAALCFKASATQDEPSVSTDMSIECGLAIFHALQAYDASLRDSGSSVSEYAPMHSNRISCTPKNDDFLIIRLWNDAPGILGGAMTYKLKKSDFSILEVVPER